MGIATERETVRCHGADLRAHRLQDARFRPRRTEEAWSRHRRPSERSTDGQDGGQAAAALRPPVQLPVGVLGFEPSHVEDIAQRVEPVSAREDCKLGGEVGDVSCRRRPVPWVASRLASGVTSARIIVHGTSTSYPRALGSTYVFAIVFSTLPSRLY